MTRRSPLLLQGRLKGWHYAALILLSIVPYLNTLGNGLVFDDFAILVVKSPTVTTPWRYFIEQPWGVGPVFRPIPTLSYAMDFAFGGTAPAIYHLSNILYHAMTVLLL